MCNAEITIRNTSQALCFVYFNIETTFHNNYFASSLDSYFNVETTTRSIGISISISTSMLVLEVWFKLEVTQQRKQDNAVKVCEGLHQEAILCNAPKGNGIGATGS